MDRDRRVWSKGSGSCRRMRENWVYSCHLIAMGLIAVVQMAIVEWWFDSIWRQSYPIELAHTQRQVLRLVYDEVSEWRVRLGSKRREAHERHQCSLNQAEINKEQNGDERSEEYILTVLSLNWRITACRCPYRHNLDFFDSLLELTDGLNVRDGTDQIEWTHFIQEKTRIQWFVQSLK